MENNKTQSTLSTGKYSFFFILLVASFFGGYLIAKRTPAPIATPSSTPPISITNSDFNIFWQVWQNLEQKFVDKSKINTQKMIQGAISGMVKSLGDPHTTYMTPDENKQFSDDISGSFEGIGAEIGIKKEILSIIAPLEDTPAKKAGLMANDKILKIDGAVTDGMSVEEAVKKIRGPKDSNVKLLIMRDGWEAPRDISIKRQAIKIPIVKLTMKNKKIAYLQLFHFTENSAGEFQLKVQAMLASGAKGVILDLRNNPGGYLESAVNIASYFLDKDALVVSEVYGDGKKDQFVSFGYKQLSGLPLIVLVNQGSASASEILAGALRDNLKIKLVGEKTYGKGSVQELVALTDQSSLKVTIAKWLTPSGQSINDDGLNPDIDVKLTEKDIANNKDPQLDKALEILSAQIK